MKSKNISFYSLIFFIVNACTCSFIINDSIRILNNDAWIIPIFGTLIGQFILKLYFKIFENKTKTNKFVDIIFFIIALLYINTLFLVLVNFINSEYLYNTPTIFIHLVLILTIVYILKNKTKSIFYTSFILMIIMIIMFIFGFIGLIRQIDLINIMPIFNNKLFNIIPATFNYIAYTTSPLFIILYYQDLKISKKSVLKTYILTNLTVFFSLFFVISIFGINLCNLYEFPAYHILKTVFEGAVIERFEKLLALYWIISMLIPIIFFSDVILKILNKFKYFILIFIMLVDIIFYSNINMIKYWNENIFPIIMNIPIILGIITYKKS